jgi:hypothetical protein
MADNTTINKLKKNMDQRLEVYNKEPRLKVVKPFYNGLNTYPPEIVQNTAAHVVFYNLQQCYEQVGNISEGIIEDLVWGFRQAGIPANITWKGLNELKKLGFIYFHDGTGRVILGDATDKLWFRWSLKFIDLLRGKFDAPKLLSKDERVEPNDINWKDIQ